MLISRFLLDIRKLGEPSSMSAIGFAVAPPLSNLLNNCASYISVPVGRTASSVAIIKHLFTLWCSRVVVIIYFMNIRQWLPEDIISPNSFCYIYDNYTVKQIYYNTRRSNLGPHTKFVVYVLKNCGYGFKIKSSLYVLAYQWFEKQKGYFLHIGICHWPDSLWTWSTNTNFFRFFEWYTYMITIIGSLRW